MSLESGLRERKCRRICEIRWQRVPGRKHKKTERMLPERFGVSLRFGTLTSVPHDERWDSDEQLLDDERWISDGSYTRMVRDR